MLLEKQAPIEQRPLKLVELEDPEPAPGEVLLEVKCCGICRTDLHIVEGELPPRK
ncbi:MAG: alcohol dehydrogenase catalytic domain-containing protein, partial [Infirmifilum sp.]